jgi:hypothetical protein
MFSASIGGQLLRAGPVDEVRIHPAAVVFGAGTRLLDDDATIRARTNRCRRGPLPVTVDGWTTSPR